MHEDPLVSISVTGNPDPEEESMMGIHVVFRDDVSQEARAALLTIIAGNIIHVLRQATSRSPLELLTAFLAAAQEFDEVEEAEE